MVGHGPYSPRVEHNDESERGGGAADSWSGFITYKHPLCLRLCGSDLKTVHHTHTEGSEFKVWSTLSAVEELNFLSARMKRRCLVISRPLSCCHRSRRSCTLPRSLCSQRSPRGPLDLCPCRSRRSAPCVTQCNGMHRSSGPRPPPSPLSDGNTEDRK